MRLCAVSVDLDEIGQYHRIHGLDSAEGGHSVYDLALERLENLARSAGIPITWFVIGSDLERAENREKVAQLQRRGDEIGNHTQNHRYDLTRRELDEQRRELEAASEAIRACTGERPFGFRAPGYTVSDVLLGVVEELGFAYDSSVFPCPSYFGLKAVKLASARIRGRRSESIMDSLSVLRAPTRPYRIGRPYFKAGSGLAELPIQVTPSGRLPFIGTALTLAGASGARLLTRTLFGEPFVNLELHGFDALGPEDPGVSVLRRVQPDAHLPASQKLETLSSVITLLQRAGYGFVRLDEAARLVLPS